ncbi:unnamed protein product [Musa hybrid cultivar]
MASWSSITLALVLIFSMSKAQGAGVECERLDASACAYAVSSSGMRCVLERNAGGAYACATSEIDAEGFVDWVETEGCIVACGLDRRTVGISSDSLLDANFRRKLCSSECFRGCPNVVNLYFNLAAGEGVFLPTLCEAQRMNAHREMAEIRSSGAAAVMAYEWFGESPAYPPSDIPVDVFPPAESPIML